LAADGRKAPWGPPDGPPVIKRMSRLTKLTAAKVAAASTSSLDCLIAALPNAGTSELGSKVGTINARQPEGAS
ncbi:MAG: hypothetical protein WBO71_11125, partial [Thermoanaerobaculia bacterium]